MCSRVLRVALALLTATVLLLAAACDENAAQSANVRYGETKCATCGAVIHDPHFASLLSLPDGQVSAFDDPGCLFRALADGETAESAVPRFHDHESHAWLAAEETWFAHTEGTESPQGYGWAAFGSFADAQDAVTGAAGSGEILPYAKAAERLTRLDVRKTDRDPAQSAPPR